MPYNYIVFKLAINRVSLLLRFATGAHIHDTSFPVPTIRSVHHSFGVINFLAIGSRYITGDCFNRSSRQYIHTYIYIYISRKR